MAISRGGKSNGSSSWYDESVRNVGGSRQHPSTAAHYTTCPQGCHSLTSIRYNKTAINVSGFGTDVPQYRKLPRAAPRATSPAQQFVAPSNSGTELDEVRTASRCIRLIACNFTTGKFARYHGQCSCLLLSECLQLHAALQ